MSYGVGNIRRIFFSFLLVPFLGNRPVFLAIYLYCGFSDVLDGYIARKTGTQSLTGARLDSLADFVIGSPPLCCDRSPSSGGVSTDVNARGGFQVRE